MSMVFLKIIKKGTRVILWSLGLAASLSGSFFIINGVLALLRGSSFFESDNLFISSICAVIAWLLMAIFLFGKETILLPVTQPATFLSNVRLVLLEMGYEVSKQSGDSLATKRGFQFLFISRGIQIHWADKQARISGSKIWVDDLRRRLRVHNVLSNPLSNPEIALPDDSQRVAGVLLKRVLINLRVSPDQLEEVNRQVLQPLAQEGDIVCEITLMANSDEGIRESIVENQVRPWLNAQGIPAEIHKDLAQMSEPPSSIFLPVRPLGNAPCQKLKRQGAQHQITNS